MAMWWQAFGTLCKEGARLVSPKRPVSSIFHDAGLSDEGSPVVGQCISVSLESTQVWGSELARWPRYEVIVGQSENPAQPFDH